MAKLAESSMKMIHFRPQLDPGEVISTNSRLSGQVAAVAFGHELVRSRGNGRRSVQPLRSECYRRDGVNFNELLLIPKANGVLANDRTRMVPEAAVR